MFSSGGLVTLRDEGKILITVGLNEVASKADNPNVPYGPEEVARSAIECAAAGACGIHFHARFDDGRQDKTGDDIYRRGMELTARESDVVMWLTAHPLGSDLTSLEELNHHWALMDRPPVGTALEFGCFDVYRVGRRPGWRDGQFVAMDDSYTEDLNNPYAPPAVLGEMLRRGLVPVVCCYDNGDARWAGHAAATGMIPSPAFLQLHMLGTMILGPSPTIAALDAYIAEARVVDDVEISFVPTKMPDRETYERLLQHALDRGLNVRVGLGDASNIYPTDTNADVVSRAIELAQNIGLEPATPAEMRAHFNIPERPGAEVTSP
jgi:3-keto-5-aminohexanoate cleavage enzyme